MQLNPDAVKNKILLPFVVFLALSLTSCKKEKDPDLTGSWYSVANYRAENGSFTWFPTNGFGQFITYYPDARFNTSNCVPTGGGTYSYNSRAAKIELNYEADRYGTVPGTATYKVEELTDTRLVVSSFSPAGHLQFKTEYVRND